MIDDHVWIGMNSIILYSTHVGKGSIIASGSLVKGDYPNNCILGGTIAKIIRKDIAWSRVQGEEDIETCGEYVDFTEEI